MGSVLDELDKELEKRNLCFARYADDLNVFVRSQRAANRVMRSVSRFVTRRLRLKVNEEKSHVTYPWEIGIITVLPSTVSSGFAPFMAG